MLRFVHIVVGLSALSVGCASSSPNNETPQQQGSAELTLEVVSEECERFIGSVNAGHAHIDNAGAMATASGKDELEERARAHESVARTIGEVPYHTPDLQRLAGFYVGISIAQAAVLRDMSASMRRSDEKAAIAATTKFEQLGQQEDVVVEELNQQCRGRSGEEPPPGAAQPAPSGAPSGSAPVPAPSGQPPSPPPATSAPSPSPSP
ncbi:MAG: hypothetical protein HOW73_00400 [Polyangiaceae bacterium]|nr:hypothetical protein [Polyangiaceae bacterium]